MDHVKFRAMEDGYKEDYTFFNEHEIEYTKGTSNKLLGALTELDEGLSGYQITRLGHSLQSATRAERDGAGFTFYYRFFKNLAEIIEFV